MKEKVIFSMRVAAQLVKLGFPIKETLPNLTNPKYNVFIFDYTPEFKKALDKLLDK